MLNADPLLQIVPAMHRTIQVLGLFAGRMSEIHFLTVTLNSVLGDSLHEFFPEKDFVDTIDSTLSKSGLLVSKLKKSDASVSSFVA